MQAAVPPPPSLAWLAPAAASLRTLDLSGCRALDPSAARAVAACGELTWLSLGGCPRLTDAAVTAVLRGTPKLETLLLHGLPLLTGAAGRGRGGGFACVDCASWGGGAAPVAATWLRAAAVLCCFHGGPDACPALCVLCADAVVGGLEGLLALRHLSFAGCSGEMPALDNPPGWLGPRACLRQGPGRGCLGVCTSLMRRSAA